MRITRITLAVKTKGRYNIFVDDEYSFSLDESQIVKIGFKKGQEINHEQLIEYKAESNFGKNYIRAVDLIGRRLRSEREIREYAFRKEWLTDNTDKVVERLYKFGYLDDERFAKSFVRSRASLRNLSKRQMVLELRKKGISSGIIDKVLSESEDYDEAEVLRRLIIKKRGNYEKEKLVAYLMRQGFKYDNIKNELGSV